MYLVHDGYGSTRITGIIQLEISGSIVRPDPDLSRVYTHGLNRQFCRPENTYHDIWLSRSKVEQNMFRQCLQFVLL
jgi:hypothetical protein